MSESELKLTLCLVRYTFGYHTDRAQMTYELMQDRAKMSRGAVYRAIELVEARGFFRRGRKSFWFVNSSKFELCYVNGVGKSSDNELNHAGKSSNFEPTKRKEEKEIKHTPRTREEMPADAPPIYSGMAFEHEPTGKALEYQHQIDEMAAALATVTGINLGLNQEKLQAEAIVLLENKYTSEQVTTCFYGENSYWRLMAYGGKKGDTPKFGNIRSEIEKAVKWDGKVPAPQPNGNGRYPTNATTPTPQGKQPTQAEIDEVQALIGKMATT